MPWKSRTLRLVHAESGQSLAELALLLPLLLLIVLGAIEMGRLAYTSIAVNNAAHAGTLYGAQNPVTAGDSTGMQNAALNDAPNITGLTATATHYCQCLSGGSNPTCTASNCTGTGNRMLIFVKVDTTAPFQALVPYPGIPSPITLHGQAIMRVPQ